MKVFRVWHDFNPTFRDTGATKITRGEFILAATVEAPDLEGAYRLTNTIDRYWAENPDVTAEKPHGQAKGWRSTSVGDVIESYDAFHMVAAIGFRRVEMVG